MKYKVKDNAVYGYAEGQAEPFLYQPQHPDGSAWVDDADATAWAELWLAHMTNPESNPFPATR